MLQCLSLEKFSFLRSWAQLLKFTKEYSPFYSTYIHWGWMKLSSSIRFPCLKMPSFESSYRLLTVFRVSGPRFSARNCPHPSSDSSLLTYRACWPRSSHLECCFNLILSIRSPSLTICVYLLMLTRIHCARRTTIDRQPVDVSNHTAKAARSKIGSQTRMACFSTLKMILVNLS